MIAVDELIKVAKEKIIGNPVRKKKKQKGDDVEYDDDLSADRLKNAAAAKKLAVFDAFEILARIEAEQLNLDISKNGPNKTDTTEGFAERRSKR